MDDWRDWFFDPRILLIGGALLGIGLGLAIGWAWPVSYYNTDIHDLHPGYKDDFVVMVGALYTLERDVAVARQLLALLSDPKTPRPAKAIVVEVTERYIARGADPTAIKQLVDLAAALGSISTPMQPYLGEGQP